MKNPCKGCVAPKRHIGCHSTCKERKEWREWYDGVLEKERMEKRCFITHGNWYQTPDGYWRNDQMKRRKD